jgi:type II secretory pathway component PulJ
MGTVIAIVIVAIIVIAVVAFIARQRQKRAEIERRHELRKGAEAHMGRAEHHQARAEMAEELLDRERAEAAQHESHARRMADEAGLDPDRDLSGTGRSERFDRADQEGGGVDDRTETTRTERDPATGRDVR